MKYQFQPGDLVRDPTESLIFVVNGINHEPEGSIYCDSYQLRCLQTGETRHWSTNICHDYLIKMSKLEALIKAGVQL